MNIENSNLAEKHFEECFGKFSKETQAHLIKVLNAMTNNMNKELENKPFKNVYGESNFLNLSKIEFKEVGK